MTKALGFTIIELLVVVTIIVVLLSLLTPAMDRAMYQAELAMCGTQQKTIVNGVLIYASSNKRRYPYRPEFYAPYNTYGTEAKSLRRGDIDFGAVFSDYMNVGSVMIDPMSNKVDLQNPAAVYAVASYQLYFGWQYETGGQYETSFTGAQISAGSTLKGMFRIGDRFRSTQPNSGGKINSFDVLVADLNVAAAGVAAAATSHPDYEGRMHNITREPPNFNVSDTYWWITTGPEAGSDRSPIDFQFMRDDGALERYEALEEYNFSRPIEENDERVVQVPVIANGTYSDWTQDLPSR